MSKDITLQDMDIDKLVHEPARLKILTFLSQLEGADFVYLMHKTGLSRGNLSSHLSKLEAADYVEIEKKFVEKIPRTMITLSGKGEKALINYKQQMLQILKS